MLNSNQITCAIITACLSFAGYLFRGKLKKMDDCDERLKIEDEKLKIECASKIGREEIKELLDTNLAAIQVQINSIQKTLNEVTVTTIRD